MLETKPQPNEGSRHRKVRAVSRGFPTLWRSYATERKCNKHLTNLDIDTYWSSKNIKLENVATKAMHCNLKDARHHASLSGLFLAKFETANLWSETWHHHFRFNDNDMAIRRRFQVFFTGPVNYLLNFYFRFIWPNDLEHVSHVALQLELGQLNLFLNPDL